MKILVIAPHPDDEVLGCGGTIARHSANGHDVYLCIVTKAYTPDWSEEFIKNREVEIKNASQILGIEEVLFLNFPTAKLDQIPQKDLNDALINVIRKIGPDILYVPSKCDLNRDHRLVFEAALVASRPGKERIKYILCYETLSETEWGKPLGKNFIPNVYVDISSTLEKKLDAMKAYQSELRGFPHPRSLEGIRVLAMQRGLESGMQYAEAFYLIRGADPFFHVFQSSEKITSKPSKRFANWTYPEIKEGKLTKYNWMVQHKENLELGYKTDIGAFTYINAKNGVVIEDYVQIGSHCSLYTISTIDEKEGPIVLKRNCRIGSHSVIMPGVTVGENAIVGAFSFVNKDIPPNTLAYGIPAKPVRKLTKEEIEKMLKEIE